MSGRRIAEAMRRPYTRAPIKPVQRHADRRPLVAEQAAQEAIDEVIEAPDACPRCPGAGAYLGCLGSAHHYRCRACGWTFTTTD